jgi:hypothetical protein
MSYACSSLAARSRSNANSSWTLRRICCRSAMPALCGQECCHRPPDDLACREVVLARMRPKIDRKALRHLERNRNRVLGNRRRGSARPCQFEIAIGLSSRQAELARQRHGSLRHANSVREQPPRRSQSVGLLCSRRTNHMTQRYYRLRRKSTTFLPRKPTIVRSNWKLPFAFREPSHQCSRTFSCTTCWTHGSRAR